MKISSDCKTQILDRLNILIKNYKKYLKNETSDDENSESSDLHQFISGKLDAYEECRDMVLKKFDYFSNKSVKISL